MVPNLMQDFVRRGHGSIQDARALVRGLLPPSFLCRQFPARAQLAVRYFFITFQYAQYLIPPS